MVFGTRPEVVKLAPVLWALGERGPVTGQHDPALSGALLAELGLDPPALGSIGGVRGVQIGGAATARPRSQPRPDVVVQGDTNSTLARVANAAASAGAVEAGLRS